MHVKLIRHTEDALQLLVGTKETRMRGKKAADMTYDEMQDHFQYMLDTIKSPFEFVDYIFEIDGVSKNFTHQFVRTRTGAYQQETSRALDMSSNPVVTPDKFSGDEELFRAFQDAVADAQAHYNNLVFLGAELQDARAVLPSNMETRIKAKFNLRTLSDTAKTRLCVRTQGEYQEVFRLMRSAILEVHPWAAPLLDPHCAATGTCAFPRYGKEKCPFYDPRMDLTQLKRDVAAKFWASEVMTANPVAKDGKSM